MGNTSFCETDGQRLGDSPCTWHLQLLLLHLGHVYAAPLRPTQQVI